MVTSVLITGATSAPGMLLMEMLRGTVGQVHAVARSDAAAAAIRRCGAIPVRHDLTACGAPPKGSADVLVHLAGVSHASAADRLAGAWGCPAAVCVSSASATVTGHPLAERVRSWEAGLIESAVRWRIVRPTMIFGSPRDRNIRLLARTLRRLPAVPRFVGGGLLQPVFVDDVAAIVWEAARRTWLGDPTLARIVAYGGPAQMTFGALCDDICGHERVRRIPIPISVGALAGLSRVSGADRRGRVGHAVSMLTSTRIVDSPDTVGFEHTPHAWLTALSIALRRYRQPPAPGGVHVPKPHPEEESR